MEFCSNSEAMEELQRVSNYRMVRKTLRAKAAGSFLFGALALGIGFNGLAFSALNAILVGIGVLLLVDAVWIIAAPKPGVMILDGSAMIVVGVWNIFVTIYNMHLVAMAGHGAGEPPFFLGLGIVQIAWGFHSFRQYARFRHMPVQEPSPDLLQKINDIVTKINKSKTKTDPDVIEFEGQTFVAKQPWKAGWLRTSPPLWTARDTT